MLVQNQTGGGDLPVVTLLARAEPRPVPAPSAARARAPVVEGRCSVQGGPINRAGSRHGRARANVRARRLSQQQTERRDGDGGHEKAEAAAKRERLRPASKAPCSAGQVRRDADGPLTSQNAESERRESNPRSQLGKLMYCLCTTLAGRVAFASQC